MTTMPLRKGELVWLSFDPTIGSEQAGYRPALVVSSDDYLKVIPRLVVVAPITNKDRRLPHHVEVPGSASNKVQGFVMTEQLRTVDTRRIKKRAGFLRQEQREQVQSWIKIWI